jgi:hypothetical protein
LHHHLPSVIHHPTSPPSFLTFHHLPSFLHSPSSFLPSCPRGQVNTIPKEERKNGRKEGIEGRKDVREACTEGKKEPKEGTEGIN